MTSPVVRRSPVHRGTVLAAVDVTPRLRRVTVQSSAMVGVAIRPAQDVELHLRDDSGRKVKRRYTIRTARPADGELDLDVVRHGDGPGANWGATASPGGPVEFQGPRGKLELLPAGWHLLIGDESAVPAIATIVEALDEPTVAVLEVRDDTDQVPVSGEVTWVHRHDHPPGTPDLLLPAVQSAVQTRRSGDARAYLLGETRSMVALRVILEAAGVAHDRIFLKGYWNQGRPDRTAGRSPENRPAEREPANRATERPPETPWAEREPANDRATGESPERRAAEPELGPPH